MEVSMRDRKAGIAGVAPESRVIQKQPIGSGDPLERVGSWKNRGDLEHEVTPTTAQDLCRDDKISSCNGVIEMAEQFVENRNNNAGDVMNSIYIKVMSKFLKEKLEEMRGTTMGKMESEYEQSSAN